MDEEGQQLADEEEPGRRQQEQQQAQGSGAASEVERMAEGSGSGSGSDEEDASLDEGEEWREESEDDDEDDDDLEEEEGQLFRAAQGAMTRQVGGWLAGCWLAGRWSAAGCGSPASGCLLNRPPHPVAARMLLLQLLQFPLLRDWVPPPVTHPELAAELR